MKRKAIFFTAVALAPLSPWAYGVIRGAGWFIQPYLIAASLLTYALCIAIAIPAMRALSHRTDHLLPHFAAAVAFIVGYAIICGIVFAYAEDIAEWHATKVGYRGDNGPREFWDDSGMSWWPTPWSAIAVYCLFFTSIIWVPGIIVATILSNHFHTRHAIDRNA